jgi:hypothetical protein
MDDRIDILAAELADNPSSLPYQGKSSREIAVLLNTVGASNETRERSEVPLWELAAAIDRTEWPAVAAPDRELLRLITGVGGHVDLTNANLRTTLAEIFTPLTPKTRAAMAALQTEPISRAESLGLGEVTYQAVEQAEDKNAGIVVAGPVDNNGPRERAESRRRVGDT